MSPILVRPVREQLEHDRIIRLLQAKFRRRFEAGMNPASSRTSRLAAEASTLYPDLVLVAQERGRRLQAVVEVETGESVNHLEALAQWAHFAKLRAAFHLYVPVRHGRRRPPAVRRQPDSRQRDLELPHGRRRGAVHARPSKPRGRAALARRRGERPPQAGGPRPQTRQRRSAKPAPSPERPRKRRRSQARAQKRK